MTKKIFLGDATYESKNGSCIHNLELYRRYQQKQEVLHVHEAL